MASTSTNNLTNENMTDRVSVANDVYARCLAAETSGATTVSFTGIRMEGHCPLRTGTQAVFTYPLADILASMRSAGGYTKDITTFAAALGHTHGKGKRGPEMIVPKRMHTGVLSLYMSFGKKAMNAVLRDEHKASGLPHTWWGDENGDTSPLKFVRQELLLARVIDAGGVIPTVATSTPAAQATVVAPATEVEDFLKAHGLAATVAAPAPAPAPAPATDITAILEQLRSGAVTPTATPATLTIESTKAELVAAVVISTGMDEAQASLLNKTTLASLI